MEPFYVKDCCLVVRTTGINAINLRELRVGIANCEIDSIYHHTSETLLRPGFDDPVYGNDFAGWASHDLLDKVLAERLGVIDPYDYMDLEVLRQDLLEIVEQRLSEVTTVPWSRHPFFFNAATTVIFDTGLIINQPKELPEAVSKMTLGSIYFHLIEARRREPIAVDDFRAWLYNQGRIGKTYADRITQAKFGFMPLRLVKKTLVDALKGAKS